MPGKYEDNKLKKTFLNESMYRLQFATCTFERKCCFKSKKKSILSSGKAVCMVDLLHVWILC